MALQGTLDTFELPDVLRLLASTKKSGCLVLRSERGEGSVWLDDGKVLVVEAPGLPGVERGEGLFDLLRAHEGSFVFEAGGEAPSGATPEDVEPLLAGAESQLVEWRAIERVVPSLGAWVSLTPELADDTITIDAETWRLIAVIAGGMRVGDLGRTVGLTEVPVSRLVRDLVELGVGVVRDEPADVAPWPGMNGDPPVEIEAEAEPDVEAKPSSGPFASAPPAFGVPHAVGFAQDEGFPSNGTAPLVGDPLFSRSPAATDHLDQAEADEIARQLAMLSPQAAQAVRAAAAAETEAERNAALDAVDDGEEPINRNLLLKFLSTVKG
jgi:Domain of unknown function (DUF4388)